MYGRNLILKNKRELSISVLYSEVSRWVLVCCSRLWAISWPSYYDEEVIYYWLECLVLTLSWKMPSFWPCDLNWLIKSPLHISVQKSSMYLHFPFYNDGKALRYAHRVTLFNAIKNKEKPQQHRKGQLSTQDNGVLTAVKNPFLQVLT